MFNLLGAGTIILMIFALLDDYRYLQEVNRENRPNQRENPVVTSYWMGIR